MRYDPIRQNIELIERYYEAWGTGQPEAITVFFTPEFAGHANDQDLDLASLLEVRSKLSKSFADQSLTTLDVVADAGKVATRWRSRAAFVGEFNGIPPTNEVVTWFGATFYRIREDKIAEMWDFRDRLAIHEQLQGHQSAG